MSSYFDRRQEFSPETKRQALRRSRGFCECGRLRDRPTGGCGVQLTPASGIYYEHIDPDKAGGRPSLKNCAVLTRTCWRLKTAAYDIPQVTKTRHMADSHYGIRNQTSRPLDGSKRSPFRKLMNGRVERRPQRNRQ